MKPCMNEVGTEEMIGGGALYERGLDTRKGSQTRKRRRGCRDFQMEGVTQGDAREHRTQVRQDYREVHRGR